MAEEDKTPDEPRPQPKPEPKPEPKPKPRPEPKPPARVDLTEDTKPEKPENELITKKDDAKRLTK